MCALGDKRWERSVHPERLQRHACTHLWKKTTAHHPGTLAQWTLALRGAPSGMWQLSVPLMLCLISGNEWEKKAEASLLPNNRTERGLSSSLFFKVSANRVYRAQCNNFCNSTLRIGITHFLLVGLVKERGAGFSLTIAARTDINLFKLMEVSILRWCGGMSSIPGHPSNSITRGYSSNNSKSIQIGSWWSVTHRCAPFVFLLLLYSSGPCYLHSSLTSSDVFTWEMCNTTPWFTE